MPAGEAIAVGAGSGREGLVADLAGAERRNLEALFRKVRRSAADPPRDLRERLVWSVGRILQRIDPLPGDEA